MTLIEIKHIPYNAETPADALRDGITPKANVYVRTNFDVPLLPEEHAIEIGGAVKCPLTITVDILRQMPQASVIATMECAGNDRLGMLPLPEGEPWEHGAVSTVKWTGVPLQTVLEMAGISPEAIEVLATAADAGEREEGRVRFARSLPLKDLHDDILLALSMNDEPLTPEHGAPVRLVVPGWYGMASVKWITHIDLITHPFSGYFHRERYVYDDPCGVTPVDHMRVKSIIKEPAYGAETGRTLTISGWAWSGLGTISSVEVAIEGGNVWHKAELGKSASAYAWTPWSLTTTLPHSGRFALRSRATDSSGSVQPDQIVWNRLGYGNNAIRQSLVFAL